MDSEMILETPYKAAMKGEWESMVDYYIRKIYGICSLQLLSL